MLTEQRLNLCDHIVPLRTRYDELFARMVVTDYYDGPTAGIGHCAHDGAAYAFQMLDWSEDADTRIFRLTMVPGESFNLIVDLCSQAEPPHWPVWVLGYENADPETMATIDSAYNTAVSHRDPISEWVVAWRNSDGLILSIRTMNDQGADGITEKSGREKDDGSFDWFAHLNI